MGRVRGLFDFSASFEPQYGEPLDGRAVVQKLADLVSTESWKAPDENVYTYVGMRVTVVGDGANNGVYWLTSPDYTNLDNWEKLGGGKSGASLRTVPFTDSEVVTISDVNGMPLVETYIRIEAASNNEGEQFLYGNCLFGVAIASQMGETAYETIEGIRYRFIPLNNQLKVFLPEISTGIVVLKS